MATTYGVSGSSPFSDFSTDLEDLLIQYIYDEWSIADPAKPAAKTGFQQTIEFRPGFERLATPYEVLCIQTDTRTTEMDTSNRSWGFMTSLEISLVAMQLDRDNVDPQLGNMEREVERIVNQYKINDISGVVNLIYKGRSRIYESATVGGNTQQTIRSQTKGSSSFSDSRWRSRIFVDMQYYKDDISA